MSAANAPIVGVIGTGVTGTAVAAHLAASGSRVAAHDVLHGAAVSATKRIGGVVVDRPDDLMACDAIAICAPAPHAELMRPFVAAGLPVVSIGDDLDDLRHLLDLDETCRRTGARVVLGAGMAPGLSGLLARHLAGQLHVVDELHVAAHGTGGPACARQHHDALGSTALGWHDGEWIEPLGGSGRDLVWFPEPVEAHDCYRAAVGDPLLLHRAFPGVGRISARVSATRRDRLTARLPMLTPPHAEGDIGAVRVEARGASVTGERVTVIAGVAGRAAQLAAAVCAAAVLRLLDVSLPAGVHGTADEVLQPLDLLHHATRFGVRVQEFTGVARPGSW